MSTDRSPFADFIGSQRRQSERNKTGKREKHEMLRTGCTASDEQVVRAWSGAVAQSDVTELWVVADGSELRKSCAKEMPTQNYDRMSEMT